MNLNDLEKLLDLKNKGAITEEEFTTQKAKILTEFDKQIYSEQDNNIDDKPLWAYFKECLTSKFCDFKGRARRKEYWSFVLFNFICAFIVSTIVSIINSLSGSDYAYSTTSIVSYALYILYNLAILIPSYAVLVRRFHDINLSGWWITGYVLLNVIFLANLITIFVLGNETTYPILDSLETLTEYFSSIKVIIISCLVLVLVILVYLMFILIATVTQSYMHENKYGPVPEGVNSQSSDGCLISAIVIIFLLIISSITSLVSGISTFTKLMKASQPLNAVSQITEIANNVQNLYKNSRNFAKVNLENAFKYNLVPVEMGNSIEIAQIGNTFNSFYDIKASDEKAKGDYKAFTIIYGGLDENNCINIVSDNFEELNSNITILAKAVGTNLVISDLDNVYENTEGTFKDGKAIFTLNSKDSNYSIKTIKDLTSVTEISDFETEVTPIPSVADVCHTCKDNTCAIALKFILAKTKEAK